MSRLAIIENLSQAYGEHIRNYERKYAISELEKKRVMGENLNGTDYSDHDTDMCELSWWEDYFKPGYDKRKAEYLAYKADPEVPFVCDVNWPIDEDTVNGGWFRAPGNITKTVIDSSTVEISWTTPEPADSQLTWTDKVYNGVWWYYTDKEGEHGPDGTDSSSTKSYNHTLRMINLAANTSYEFRICSTNDTNGPPNLSTQKIWGYVGTYP